MSVFILFLFGLAIGSFLNVLIDRLPQDESIVKGRSYCDKCKKTLKWYDLIPVLSFLILGRKCRYCHSPISFYYPVVEVITGVLFVLIYSYVINLGDLRITNYELRFFTTLSYYLVIVSSLIVVFFADLKYGIIPDKIVFPAIIFSFFFLFFTSKESWFSFPLQLYTLGVLVNKFSTAVGGFAFFLFLYLLTKGKGMGFGDVKLVFLLGLFLGFPKIIPAFYISFLTGAFVGLVLIILKKKKLFSGATIPFGPFLVLGTFISLFFGERIIKLFIY